MSKGTHVPTCASIKASISFMVRSTGSNCLMPVVGVSVACRLDLVLVPSLPALLTLAEAERFFPLLPPMLFLIVIRDGGVMVEGEWRCWVGFVLAMAGRAGKDTGRVSEGKWGGGLFVSISFGTRLHSFFDPEDGGRDDRQKV